MTALLVYCGFLIVTWGASDGIYIMHRLIWSYGEKRLNRLFLI